MNILNKKGQTLVEAIGAIAVILVGVITTVALFVSSINALTIASLKSQAKQLAVEQVEAARWLRDSNWLHEEAGETDFDSFEYVPDNDYGFLVTRPDSGDPTEHYEFYYRPSINSTCSPFSGDHPCKEVAIREGFFYQNFYGNYSLYTPAPNPTIFNRWVEFYRICEDDLPRTLSGACPVEQIGVQVLSKVQFTKGTQDIEYVLEERLYDWKY